LGGVVGEKTGNAKKVVWWWPLPVPGGGNGDGWTNRYTLAHRNADAVCVSSKREEREREHGGVFNPAVVEVVECTISSLRESADRCNTRHRRGADPARGRRRSSHPAREAVDYGNTGGCGRRRSPSRRRWCMLHVACAPRLSLLVVGTVFVAPFDRGGLHRLRIRTPVTTLRYLP
jgi:hypothetical protein